MDHMGQDHVGRIAEFVGQDNKRRQGRIVSVTNSSPKQYVVRDETTHAQLEVDPQQISRILG
ncbi:hypothetical protein [Streptomyces sp. NPDC089799]|uniref:hypothetical protein n=1 Tax=Streptomyces sp. NPDC089799 TaxID=3155066 RepID=UPI0034303D37